MTASETLDARTPDTVIGQLVGDLAGSLGVLLVALGNRTGLWAALREGARTPHELAACTGVAEPLAREWCRAQVAGNYLEHNADGTFALPDPVAGALLHGPGGALVDACTEMIISMAAGFDEFATAFAAGEGFGWNRRDLRFLHGTDALTRVMLPDELIGAILAATAPVADGSAHFGSIVDVGCGYGAPTLAMARHLPDARVLGVDYSDVSVANGRRAARDAGLGNRVRFECAAATELPGSGHALVTFFDVLHDLGDPVAALVRAREVLAPGGAVLLVEPLAGDRLEDNLTPPGRMFYAVSTLICTPNALSQSSAHAPLGAQAGEALLRSTAAAAGFTRVRRVPVAAPLNLALELRP
jgi:SAM-dependent methyltransferase